MRIGIKRMTVLQSGADGPDGKSGVEGKQP